MPPQTFVECMCFDNMSLQILCISYSALVLKRELLGSSRYVAAATKTIKSQFSTNLAEVLLASICGTFRLPNILST